jgi:hypothetical protein
VVSGGLGRWLRARGVRTEGLEMRALVPVSVRAADEHGTLGNRLTVMRGPLPVYIRDPVARLRVVRQAMDGLKESKQAVGAATLAAVNDLAPPTILAQASRLNFSTRLFNLIVTNIPGPQMPLYVLGRKLEDLFPVAFLPSHHALAVAIMSYNGSIDYGLLADYDALPDLDLIVEGIEASLDELLVAARARQAKAEEAHVRSGVGERAAGRIAKAGSTREAESETGPAKAKPRGRRSPGTNGGPVPIVPGGGERPTEGPAADMRRRRRRQNRPGGNGERHS